MTSARSALVPNGCRASAAGIECLIANDGLCLIFLKIGQAGGDETGP